MNTNGLNPTTPKTFNLRITEPEDAIYKSLSEEDENDVDEKAENELKLAVKIFALFMAISCIVFFVVCGLLGMDIFYFT